MLRAAALAGDTAAAGALCVLVRDNPPGANSTLDPDWRGAAYIAAVVQPPGCIEAAVHLCRALSPHIPQPPAGTS